MIVYINSEAKEVKSEKSLQETLTDLSLNVSFGTAVAINNKVVPKNDWDTYILKENDKVLVIKASQGG
jgi:sulfur carrier protein